MLVRYSPISGPAANIRLVAVRICFGARTSAHKKDGNNNQQQKGQKLQKSFHNDLLQLNDCAELKIYARFVCELVIRRLHRFARRIENVVQIYLAPVARGFAFRRQAPFPREYSGRQRESGAEAEYGRHLIAHLSLFVFSQQSMARNTSKCDVSCAGTCSC